MAVTDTPTSQWSSELSGLSTLTNSPTSQWSALVQLATPPGVNNTFVSQWSASLFVDITPPSRNVYLQKVYMIGSDVDGDVQAINIGKDDNSTPIFYELESQDIELGNRANLKQIAGNISTLNQNGIDGSIAISANDSEYEDLSMKLDRRNNLKEDSNIEGNYFNVKWYGNSQYSSPILEGIKIEDINDLKVTYG